MGSSEGGYVAPSTDSESRPFLPARQLAAAGGLLLVVSLFVNWYGIDFGNTPAGGAAEGFATRAQADTSASAWDAFEAIDVVLVAAGLLGVAAGIGPLMRKARLAARLAPAAAAGGAVAVLLIVYRLADEPGPDELLTLEAGVFLGLVGALLLTAGAAGALRGPAPRRGS